MYNAHAQQHAAVRRSDVTALGQILEEEEEEEEEEIYLAQTQQIKCKYKSYTIQLSRVTGKPEGQLCRPP